MWVAAEARRGAPEGLVAVADLQTAGRGRLDRRWVAPAGSGLLCSVLVRPAVPTERLHLVSFAMALAVVDSVGFAASLKWPNDVIVPARGERKLAGILAEAVDAGADAAVVVGVGVNVTRPATIDPEVGDRAVWLSELTVADRSALLVALLRAFAGRLGQLEDTPEATVSDYRAACTSIGRRVRVALPDGGFDGVALDLDPHAGLVVRDDAGTLRVVTAGDVVHAALV